MSFCWTGFHSSVQHNTSSVPTIHFTTSMVACMCFPLLPETECSWGGREGEAINAESGDNPIGSAFISQVAPLANPQAQLYDAQHGTQLGVEGATLAERAVHVAVPASLRGVVPNPTMLRLPSVQVAPLAPHWLSARLKWKLLHILAVRL